MNLVGVVVGLGVLGVAAVAFAKSKDTADKPKLTVVWNGTKWVYAEIRPDGIFPTDMAAPPPVSPPRYTQGRYSRHG